MALCVVGTGEVAMAPECQPMCLRQHGARLVWGRDGDRWLCAGPMCRHTEHWRYLLAVDTPARRLVSPIVRWMFLFIQQPLAHIMSDGRFRATDKRCNVSSVRRAARVSRRARQRFLSPILRLADPDDAGLAYPTSGAGNGLIRTRNPCLRTPLSSSSGSEDRGESDLKLVN